MHFTGFQLVYRNFKVNKQRQCELSRSSGRVQVHSFRYSYLSTPTNESKQKGTVPHNYIRSHIHLTAADQDQGNTPFSEVVYQIHYIPTVLHFLLL